MPDVEEAVAALRAHIAARAPSIVDAYVTQLRAQENTLLVLGEPAVRASCLGMLQPVITGDPASDPPPTRLAVERANAMISPAASIGATGHLYELAAQAISDGAEELNSPPAAVGRVHADLHRAVFHRIYASAMPYAHHLLAQISRAHLEERRRIARDLHDHAAHAVMTAQLEAELRAEEVRGTSPEAAAHLESVVDAMGSASLSIHQISRELGRSSAVERLADALTDYVASTHDPRVTLTVSGRTHLDAVPVWMQDELYLAAREAIRNALRHSDADTVVASLDGRPECVRVEVRDDGVGMPPGRVAEVTSAGEGLGALRDRIRLLSGTVEVQTAPGDGTRVTMEVPLQA